MPSAVSTRTNTHGALPRTPVKRKGSTLTILSDVSDSCAHNDSLNLPDAIRLPVRPQDACLRKERREPSLACLMTGIKSFIVSKTLSALTDRRFSRLARMSLLPLFKNFFEFGR